MPLSSAAAARHWRCVPVAFLKMPLRAGGFSCKCICLRQRCVLAVFPVSAPFQCRGGAPLALHADGVSCKYAFPRCRNSAPLALRAGGVSCRFLYPVLQRRAKSVEKIEVH